MKKILALATFALFSANALADGLNIGDRTPSVNEIHIKNIIYGGPGCPQDSASTMVTSSDPSNPDRADFFEIIYDSFYVEKGPGTRLPDQRKNCTVAVDLHIPQGWQFSIMDVHYRGFADIPSRNMGMLTTEYSFPHFSNKVTTRKTVRGPFAGDYGKQDTLGIFSRVWSPCGRTIPLNMKSTLWVRGPRDDAAFMTVDEQTGLLKQKWAFQWRRCTP